MVGPVVVEGSVRMRDSFRDLDLTIYEGKTVSLTLQHSNNNHQYARFDLDDIVYAGWLGKVYGEKGDTTEKTIREMFLVQHSNGGRHYAWKAKTYEDYFNNEVKEKVMAKRATGIFGSLCLGDVESADIIVYFTDGTSLDTMQFIDCPEEWYTEQYEERGEEMLDRGFHGTPTEADAAQRPTDDMFGERFFPVVAFPISTAQREIDDVIWIPKAISLPIRTGTHVIYGSRCKPSECSDFIHRSYDIGGKVIRGTSWDW